MFNAGTERFVRDWRTAHVAVTVKDSRMRENDAVLGTVSLKVRASPHVDNTVLTHLRQLSEVFVNASEVTRCYSLEKGLGAGRIRISLLFRPVEAKLPPNLLGFDTGSLEIGSVSVQSEQVDVAKCEVRLKLTTGEAEEKVSRKAAERRDDRIVWAPSSPTKLPVRQRYAAALLVSFRDASAFKSSGRKALGVLWLRDLVDRTSGPVEVSLWRAKDGDYSRLKFNYVPPDGDLSCWDSDGDREKVERVGSVVLDLVFWPGITREHYEMLNGQGARKRGSWDEFDRQQNAGFRDAVGELAVKVPQDHQAQESHETEARDGGKPGSGEADKTTTDGAMNRQGCDHKDASGNAEGHGTNTIVSADSVEVESSAESTRSASSGAEGQESGEETDGSEKKHGSSIIGKAKERRKHQKELHRDHRGVMQAKPVRTVEWIKDNLEDSAHAVKDRFKMKARQPDIETEV